MQVGFCGRLVGGEISESANSTFNCIALIKCEIHNLSSQIRRRTVFYLFEYSQFHLCRRSDNWFDLD